MIRDVPAIQLAGWPLAGLVRSRRIAISQSFHSPHQPADRERIPHGANCPRARIDDLALSVASLLLAIQ